MLFLQWLYVADILHSGACWFCTFCRATLRIARPMKLFVRPSVHRPSVTFVYCIDETSERNVFSNFFHFLVKPPFWVFSQPSIYTGWPKKTGPACFIANILKTPRPNCVKVGEFLQYCMPNAVITFLFKSFVALWRHLAKNVAIVWCSNLFVQC